MKVAIVDIDSMIYECSKESVIESIIEMDKRILNLCQDVQATHLISCITLGKLTFRHILYPEYKKKREKYPTLLHWIKTLKNYLIEGWGATYHNSIEADDYVVFWKHKLDKLGIANVLISPDKDVLYNVEGLHYNYSSKVDDELRWIRTTKEDAIYHFNLQMLMGDSSDNVPGLDEPITQWIRDTYNISSNRIKKVRETAAELILKHCIENHLNIEDEVKKCYQSIYEDKWEEMYKLNYTLLKMIDNEEEMFSKAGILMNVNLENINDFLIPLNNPNIKKEFNL